MLKLIGCIALGVLVGSLLEELIMYIFLAVLNWWRFRNGQG